MLRFDFGTELLKIPLAQMAPTATPPWAIWIPVASAFVSIIGAAVGSYLSAKYFSATAQRKALLNTEKLSRYTKGLNAFHSYKIYLEEVFDIGSRDFRKVPPDVLKDKIEGIKVLSQLLSEKNFILSNQSFLVIRDFFYECELEWEHHNRATPSDDVEAFFGSESAVKKAIENFVVSARKDMGWPTQPGIKEA